MDKIQITAPKGARRNKKTVGRGTGSGHGLTSGRGSKGQKARAGGSIRLGFEGGQMPLYRRIATRGFSNYRFKKKYTIIKVGDLEIFDNGTKVTKEELLKNNVISKRLLPVKILTGKTELTKKLIVEIDKASKSAKEKILALGGEVIEKELPKEQKEKKSKKKKTKETDEDKDSE